MGNTVKDVAKLANVSHGTVSRYLNGFNLNEQNRIRVQNAIETLNYKQNILASGLRNNRSMTIGVVMRILTDIFNTSIVTSIEKVLEQNNYSIVLCDYENDDKRQLTKLRFLKDRAIDGLIFFSKGLYVDILDEYVKDNIPVVLINDDISGFNVDKVMVDNANASFRATEKLIHLNHTKIAIINDQDQDKYNSVGKERYRGYLEAHEIYNIPINPDYVKHGGFSVNGGYNTLKELLSSKTPPTAVYVTNYYMTLGVYIAINEMGVKVPDELSVIGFDYFNDFDIIRPRFSYVEQPVQKIGETAASLILKRIKGDYSDYPMVERLNTKMVITNSIKEL